MVQAVPAVQIVQGVQTSNANWNFVGAGFKPARSLIFRALLGS
jgi:hypothetical protein